MDDVEVIGIRKTTGGEPSSAAPLSRPDETHGLRIGDARNGSKQRPVRQTEDRRGRTDAERQRQHRDGGEARRFDDQSCRKANVLAEFVIQPQAARLAALIFDGGPESELASCAPIRLVARNARPRQVVCVRVDVKLQLVAHVLLEAAAARQRINERAQRLPHLTPRRAWSPTRPRSRRSGAPNRRFPRAAGAFQRQ